MTASYLLLLKRSRLEFLMISFVFLECQCRPMASMKFRQGKMLI